MRPAHHPKNTRSRSATYSAEGETLCGYLLSFCILPLLATAAYAGRCDVNVDEMKKGVAKAHGVWIELKPAQWQFLRGVSALWPSSPPGLPFGSRAVLTAPKGEKNALILFIDGKKACDMLPIPEVLVKMVHDVGAPA